MALHVTGNTIILRNMQYDRFLNRLRHRLPDGWAVEFIGSTDSARTRDGRVVISAPDGTRATLLAELNRNMSARQATRLTADLAPDQIEQADGLIVFTSYLSPTARERLREARVSYIDTTGNLWVRTDRPAVLLEQQGAQRDPDPPRRGVRSLKGAKAARIVRGLCDWKPPHGVRELARKTGASPGYATRVLTLLEDDDLVNRGEQGEVVEVRWPDLIRRWSMDYSVAQTNRAFTFLAPRGLGDAVDKLRPLEEGYAITGVFGVPDEARVVAPALLICYVEDVTGAAEELDLRPADSGANVLLLDPFDDLVFRRTRTEDGIVAVALSQCAVDLLTGSGREPAQGEALIDWMREHEDAWRT